MIAETRRLSAIELGIRPGFCDHNGNKAPGNKAQNKPNYSLSEMKTPAPACFGNLAEKSGASGACRGLLLLQSRDAPVYTIKFEMSHTSKKKGHHKSKKKKGLGLGVAHTRALVTAAVTKARVCATPNPNPSPVLQVHRAPQGTVYHSTCVVLCFAR